jgi:hypothetical protein
VRLSVSMFRSGTEGKWRREGDNACCQHWNDKSVNGSLARDDRPIRTRGKFDVGYNGKQTFA